MLCEVDGVCGECEEVGGNCGLDEEEGDVVEVELIYDGFFLVVLCCWLLLEVVGGFYRFCVE